MYQLLDIELAKLGKSLESVLGVINLYRLVGYCLLILAFFDLVDVVYPLNFMNPVWEFQTMGSLVERVAIPLVALLLVFSGKLENRLAWEFPVLGILSRLTLLVSLLYILLLPLGVSNTIRLYNNNLEQFHKEYNQQLSQAKHAENQISQATPTELKNMLERQGRSLDNKKPEEVKSQMLSGITQAKQQIKAQAEEKKSSANLRLFKSSVKWNLGALISAFLFMAMWRGTNWTRQDE
ncbi:MAG: HpsJ family protein [Mojavia pulchra JT2-VF2]|jgi:hypothetical protein|uniref:HpsJ family protein n=1 Tax=Mojavia pulchra JT2-VF2 TaxID=287848 RepID=A0A951PZT9_9NOST|nr:HpsJ family protein [Mojavia pulchra JT2-VF2]